MRKHNSNSKEGHIQSAGPLRFIFDRMDYQKLNMTLVRVKDLPRAEQGKLIDADHSWEHEETLHRCCMRANTYQSVEKLLVVGAKSEVRDSIGDSLLRFSVAPHCKESVERTGTYRVGQ